MKNIYHTKELSQNQIKWKQHYEKMCQRGKDRAFSRYQAELIFGHVEAHHIIPLCLFGPNNEENVVYLSPEEHYVAHQLLLKVFPNITGLSSACVRMSGLGKFNNNKLYGWIKRLSIKNQTILSKVETLNVIKQVENGIAFGIIHKNLLSQGIKISYSALPIIYKRETGKSSKEYLAQFKMDSIEIKNSIIKLRELGMSFKDINDDYFNSLSYGMVKKFYYEGSEDRNLEIVKVDKKSCKGTKRHQEKITGRNKNTHRYLANISELRKRQNKNNSERVKKQSELVNILPEEIRIIAKEKRLLGQNHEEIYTWVLELGFNLARSTLRGIINRQLQGEKE